MTTISRPKRRPASATKTTAELPRCQTRRLRRQERNSWQTSTPHSSRDCSKGPTLMMTVTKRADCPKLKQEMTEMTTMAARRHLSIKRSTIYRMTCPLRQQTQGTTSTLIPAAKFHLLLQYTSQCHHGQRLPSSHSIQ